MIATVVLCRFTYNSRYMYLEKQLYRSKVYYGTSLKDGIDRQVGAPKGVFNRCKSVGQKFLTKLYQQPCRMSLDQKFQEAVEAVKALTKRPTDHELLELYALYKQATVGNVNKSKPGMMDLKGKAKWEAWKAKEGMSQNDAKEAYIKYANTLIEKCK